jgi:hypothetical protein
MDEWEFPPSAGMFPVFGLYYRTGHKIATLCGIFLNPVNPVYPV